VEATREESRVIEKILVDSAFGANFCHISSCDHNLRAVRKLPKQPPVGSTPAASNSFRGLRPANPLRRHSRALRRPALFRRAHSLRSIAASARPREAGKTGVDLDSIHCLSRLSATGRTEGVMYDVGTGAPNPTGEHGVTGVLSPDNQSLLYLGANQSLMIWDKASGSTRELRGPKDESLCQPQDWYQHWCEQQRVKRVARPVEHATQTGAFVGPFRLDW
jgi:hypothetical protein